MRHLRLTDANDYPQGTFLELPFPADSHVPARLFAQRRHNGAFEFSILYRKENLSARTKNADVFEPLSLRVDKTESMRGDLWIESNNQNNPISWAYYRVLTDTLPSVLYAKVGDETEVIVPMDAIETLPQEILKSGVSVSRFQDVFTRVSMMRSEPNFPPHMWFRLHPLGREPSAHYRNGPDDASRDCFVIGYPQSDLEIELL